MTDSLNIFIVTNTFDILEYIKLGFRNINFFLKILEPFLPRINANKKFAFFSFEQIRNGKIKSVT